MKRTAGDAGMKRQPLKNSILTPADDNDTTPINVIVFDEDGMLCSALHHPGGMAGMTPAERFLVRHASEVHEKGDADDVFWAMCCVLEDTKGAMASLEEMLDNFRAEVPAFTEEMRNEVLGRMSNWTYIDNTSHSFVLPVGRTIVHGCSC